MKWRKTFKLAFNDNVKLIYVQRKDVTIIIKTKIYKLQIKLSCCFHYARHVHLAASGYLLEHLTRQMRRLD